MFIPSETLDAFAENIMIIMRDLRDANGLKIIPNSKMSPTQIREAALGFLTSLQGEQVKELAATKPRRIPLNSFLQRPRT